MKVSKWKSEIEMSREKKDTFFSSHPQSPIPYEERSGFEKLNYYSPDPEYRFELDLQVYTNKENVKVKDTQGNERQFLKWGEFKFKIQGKKCSLQVYKNDPFDERLFIPFKDKTSGNETYGAGRYLDLELDQDQNSEEKWILDFNKAYNPWCAYNNAFACPYVLPENWLNVPVYAGEKYYKK